MRVSGRRDERGGDAHLDAGGARRGRQLHPAAVRAAVAREPQQHAGNQLFGNYHVTAGVAGRPGHRRRRLYNGANNVPLALGTDFDREVRPTVAPHRGADQVGATVAPPPTLTSISPASSTVAQRGTTITVTLTGTNLTGATAVNVSGAGVTVRQLHREQQYSDHRELPNLKRWRPTRVRRTSPSPHRAERATP